MALDLTVPIIDLDDYRGRTGRKPTTRDAESLTPLLLSMTRLVERRLGVAPGMLTPQTSASFVFDSQAGGDLLWLRDVEDRQYLLRTITADSLKIDDDADGVFDDYTLDFDDAWVEGYPRNAATLAEPFTAVRLIPVTTASITAWPKNINTVEITGNWGWAATPEPLKDRVANIIRELLEVHHGAPVVDLDEVVNDMPNTRRIMAQIEAEYSYRVPAIA